MPISCTSYFLDATDRSDILAETDYGGPVTAAVAHGNRAGTQFHPEKSQTARTCPDRQFSEVDAMILFPAIDLKDGECVRLKLGDMNEATVYNTDPAAQAQEFEKQGFSWLHVVDLNGAFAGESINGRAVEAILAATGNPVQLGGGIRTLDNIAYWLEKGLAAGHSRHRRGCGIRTWSNRPAATFPDGLRSASTPAAARIAVEGWAEASRTRCGGPGATLRGRRCGGHHLHRHRDRDGRAHRDKLGADTGPGRRGGYSGHLPPADLASMADILRMTMPDAGSPGGRDFGPRAL